MTYYEDYLFNDGQLFTSHAEHNTLTTAIKSLHSRLRLMSCNPFYGQISGMIGTIPGQQVYLCLLRDNGKIYSVDHNEKNESTYTEIKDNQGE